MTLQPEDYEPFDLVELRRERGANGEPTPWYTITGYRQGGERSVRIHGEQLLEIADMSREMGRHYRDMEHALIHAAIACLMD
jgi:hypothetical protein